MVFLENEGENRFDTTQRKYLAMVWSASYKTHT